MWPPYQYSQYADEDHNGPFQTVVMIGVGTAMKHTDYAQLSQTIVVLRPSVLVVVVDFANKNPIKLSSYKFVKAVNAIMAKLQSSGTIDKQTSVIVGGHSAGGFAAAASFVQKEKYTITPVAYLGLDPVPSGVGPFPGRFSATIPKPSLVVGLQEASCGVDPQRSARAAYSKSSASYRVLLSIQNPNAEYKHCVFTDNGCGMVCGKLNQHGTPALVKAIARAISLLVDDLWRSDPIADREAYVVAVTGASMKVSAINDEQVKSKADVPWWKF